MIENAALLKSAAGEIDALDAEIRALQDDKKTVFDNIKESVEPPTFKAWKEAVKLRQKRRVDKDALEAHDARVWAVLAMLEATGTEVATRAPSGAEAHDPETGEITDPDPPEPAQGGDDADLVLRSAAGEQVSSVPPRPLAGSLDMGDLPECLDRRARAYA
jgi:uncharacterized protein (UPF0335 family)